MQYIALIRGVTPSGKNRVPMALLREALADVSEFSDIKTYIQSGNVLLKTDSPADFVSDKLKTIIKNEFGGDLEVVVKTPDQLQTALDDYPYKDLDTAKQYYCFLKHEPNSEGIAKLAERDFAGDRYTISGDRVFIGLATSASESKLTNNVIEQKLGLRATTRNYNTTKKLTELSQ